MTNNIDAEPAIYRENPPRDANRANWAAAKAALEFGRFRILLRRRQLVTDCGPIALGTRTLDLLLALLEANGSLVTKDELFSIVWPNVVVSEANLKVQIWALRNALGEDRDFIRTEFGRGYRFTAAVRSIVIRSACRRPIPHAHRTRHSSVSLSNSRQPPHARSVARSRRQPG